MKQTYDYPNHLKRRGKAVKIAFLKRSAAAKVVHHRRRLKKHVKFHFQAFAVAITLTVGVGSALAAQLVTLVPPPGNEEEVISLIRAAKAQAAAEAQANQATPAQIGEASWYALGLRSPDALTCASRAFPRGTKLRVRDLRNGKEVICLVNDYGPVAGTNRILDLSRGSYRSLEGLGSGTMPIEIWTAGN